MTQSGWQERLTGVIAAEVRRERVKRKLSTQQLADRCDRLGFPIPRSVLANLENGRREAVSVAELLVLAAALEVAPGLLVNPLGHQATTEVLPGRELPAWEAILWLSGQVRLPNDAGNYGIEWLNWQDDQGIVPLYRRHYQLTEDLSVGGAWLAQSLTGKRGKIDQVASQKLQREARERLEDDLRAVRTRMRAVGLTPPELPADLSHIETQQRHRGPH